MPGAPMLTATAALRGGAGLVKVLADRDVLDLVLTMQPSATGRALDVLGDEQPSTAEQEGDDDVEAALLRAVDDVDPLRRAVLAVGPGMGTGRHAQLRVTAALSSHRPVVLDADGLNHLAATEQRREGDSPLILTPHPGEFRRLAAGVDITADPTREDDRPRGAAALAVRHRAVVLLKGSRTVVTDGERLYINATGNPVMATAGSGDVLTGLIASLVGQGMSPFDAACLGAHLHGLAGDLWRDARGQSGMLAIELASYLPEAFERHRRDSAAE